MNAITKVGVHGVAPSLYLQVRDHGTRSWLFRYSRNNKNQWLGLGSAHDKSYSDARDEAAMLRVMVKQGRSVDNKSSFSSVPSAGSGRSPVKVPLEIRYEPH